MTTPQIRPESTAYPAVLRQESLSDGRPWFVAFHPDLPGCMADGPTREIALQELDEARKEFIASLIEDGLPVPVPSGNGHATIGTEASIHRPVVSIPSDYHIEPSKQQRLTVEVSTRIGLAAAQLDSVGSA
ncbi:hypothetical protein BH23CHL4_BH23CHL4_24020 [soil metagenome]